MPVALAGFDDDLDATVLRATLGGSVVSNGLAVRKAADGHGCGICGKLVKEEVCHRRRPSCREIPVRVKAVVKEHGHVVRVAVHADFAIALRKGLSRPTEKGQKGGLQVRAP